LQRRVFLLGLVNCLLLFIAANVWNFRGLYDQPTLLDAPRWFGVPVEFYGVGGFGGDYILWSNLGADVAVALTAGLLVGWASALISRRSWGNAPPAAKPPN